MANAFEGTLLKPGSRVEHAALWPVEGYPDIPLLLEFAGSDHTGRGHNRGNQIYVLWRFENERWVEIARTLSVGAEWIPHMLAIALRELGGPAAIDPALAEKVADRFLSILDRELMELGAGDRALVLNFVFEQVSARLMKPEPVSIPL
jgi:hypothetical protein